MLFSKVYSITTDMGTELGIPDTPGILRAWLRRRLGIPLELCEKAIDFSSKLLPNCVRMNGRSHLFGNVMKSSCYRTRGWPAIVKKLQDCCKFWRCNDWRKVVIKALDGKVVDVEVRLATFNAKLAKWRYETAYDVFLALDALRDIAQGHLQDIDVLMGHGFEDKEFIKEVKAAFRDKDFWVFIHAKLVYELTPPPLRRRGDGA